jgi:5-methylcytosine-specific restriction protein B
MTIKPYDDAEKQRQLDDFLKEWPLERLPSMTLQDYTVQIGEPGAEKSFGYMLSYQTPGQYKTGKPVGRMGIAKCPKDGFKQLFGEKNDGVYMWKSDLGSSAEEAFGRIKNDICLVASAARRGQFALIDKVGLISGLKWYIAFIYQDLSNPKVTNLYSEEKLRDKMGDQESPVSVLQAKAVEDAKRAGYGSIWAWKNDVLDAESAVNEPRGADEKPVSGTRVWLAKFSREFAPPSVEEMRGKGIYTIPFLEHIDMTGISRRSELTDQDVTGKWASKIWLFAKEVKVGDELYLEEGDKKVLAHGVVTRAYSYDAKLGSGFIHSIGVRWTPTFFPVRRKLPGGGMWFREITEKSNLLSDLRAERRPPAQSERPSFEPLNLILHGPPGTGKTFCTKRLALEICKGAGRLKPLGAEITKEEAAQIGKDFEALIEDGEPQVEFVTFHQNYDYADFVEGYRPCDDGRFEVRDGIFKRMALRAEADPSRNYLLIIDEINRGNISKIFGELITLLEDDKRLGRDFELTPRLPVSGEEFGVPPNLYVLGTMNTADRSIALLDIALRRRFEFEEIAPNPSMLKPAKLEGGTEIDQEKLLVSLNSRIEEELGRDYQIGQAWMVMGENPSPEKVVERFRKKVVPLLEEWFHDTEQKLWDEDDAILPGLTRAKLAKLQPAHLVALIGRLEAKE